MALKETQFRRGGARERRDRGGGGGGVGVALREGRVNVKMRAIRREVDAWRPYSICLCLQLKA